MNNVTFFQNIDAFEVELQNFETQVAKLRDRGERFNLPAAAIQEVYKLEVKMQNNYKINIFPGEYN